MTDRSSPSYTLATDMQIQAAKVADPALRDVIEGLIDSGRTNADDTVFIEHEAPASEWAGLFVRSIAGLLATGDYDMALDWFAVYGVRP